MRYGYVLLLFILLFRVLQTSRQLHYQHRVYWWHHNSHVAHWSLPWNFSTGASRGSGEVNKNQDWGTRICCSWCFHIYRHSTVSLKNTHEHVWTRYFLSETQASLVCNYNNMSSMFFGSFMSSSHITEFCFQYWLKRDMLWLSNWLLFVSVVMLMMLNWEPVYESQGIKLYTSKVAHS